MGRALQARGGDEVEVVDHRAEAEARLSGLMTSTLVGEVETQW